LLIGTDKKYIIIWYSRIVRRRCENERIRKTAIEYPSVSSHFSHDWRFCGSWYWRGNPL